MSSNKVPKLGIIDPSSYSIPEKVRVTEIELFLNILFEKNTLKGKVHLKCEKKKNVITNHLILDIKDLNIFKITDISNNKDLHFEVGKQFGSFGSSLAITLPEKEEDNIYNISIEYETSPKASALQWLTPEQTLGQQAPFLFSQCQAIHCRSIIPCQDTPSVKCPFRAEIIAPKQVMVLMSGIKTDEPVLVGTDRLLWKFAQNIPIPSYLIAIVAGRLAKKTIGSKSVIYAEPEIINECAFEFSETDKMLNAAIRICGPYLWGRYDLLVLPPSFPFGGMENPCLTFITPTLLAGDKSLANVVAHEIAHSWTGNLVTNVNFEHFWLNEGFTTYIERKIIGLLYGEPYRHFQAILGLSSLQDTVVRTLGDTNPLTSLVPKLKQVDPDDAFSNVPYEKGHTLLFYLETLLNKEGMFDKFLKSYLDKFKFQTVKTEDFKNYLYEFFNEKKEILNEIDWNTWLYCPGMPPIIPEYDRSLVNNVEILIDKWNNWTPTEKCLFDSFPFTFSDFDSLISAQKCLFFANLLDKDILPIEKLKLMNKAYRMEEVKNSEVRFAWLRLTIKGRWKEIIPNALRFVNEQGRMKFVRPIYKDLYNWEEARKMALDNFAENKKFMMTVLVNQLEKDLHLNVDPQEENYV